MNRSEALALWARAAAGDLEHGQACPVDLHAWIRQVAHDLLEADAAPAGARPGAVLAAVGLAGKADAYAELRAFVDGPQWAFQAHDSDGQAIHEADAAVVRKMVDQARERGLLVGVYAVDDKKALQLVRDLRTKQL